MSRFFLHSFLVTVLLSSVVLQHSPQCDNSFCNNRGVCFFENGAKKCECVERAYSGERCNQIDNHCKPDPCRQGGMCNNYVGGYFCECNSDYGAQNCSFKGKPTLKAYLHFNRVVPVNSPQYILIILKDLGNVETNVDIYNSGYAIDAFSFPKYGPQFFVKSNNLKSVCSQFSIGNSKEIPFNSGYYLAVRVRIVELGSSPIILTMSDAAEYDLLYFRIFYILTYKSTEECFPHLSCSKCFKSRQPLPLVIDQPSIIDPVVERSCGADSQLNFKWTIWNYLSTQKLHTFEDAPHRELHIPPHTLIFTDGTEFFQYYYTLVLKVTEISNDEELQGSSYFRCYVHVKFRPPKAIITGGNYREANGMEGFVVSARESEDVNLGSRSDSKLTYSWRCTGTSNTSQKYCNSIIGQKSHVYISRNIFQIGEKINFTVKVGTGTIKEIDIAWQEITIVGQYRLLVGITCVKNCDRRLFNNQDLLHLKADCKTCHYFGAAKYSWQVTFPNQSGIQQLGRRFILEDDLIPKVNKFIVRVKVKWKSNVGYAAIELNLNTPPKRGQCTSEPTTGAEFYDIFTIKCEKYEDVNYPIIHSIYQGEKLLHRTTDVSVKTRLIAGEPVSVKVCDSLHACTLTTVNVQVIEASNMSSQKANLWKVLQAGDRVGGVVLIGMTSKQIYKLEDGEKKQKEVRTMVNIMDMFEVTTDVAALQASWALRELTRSIDMHYSLVIPISKVLTIIGEGLIKCARIGELIFIHREECLQITKELSEVVERMFEEIEHFPVVHNYENFQVEQSPFYENYPDYPELDFNLIVQIEDWRQSSISVQHIFHALGTVAAVLMEPEEPKMDLEFSSMNVQLVSIAHDNITNIKLDKWGNELLLNDTVLQSIFDMIPSSKLAVQVIFIKNNPFWWYPEQFKISSNVILVNMFNEMINNFDPNINTGPLGDYFDLFLNVKELKPLNGSNSVKKEVTGYVNRSSDLVLYSTKCFAGSIIVYDFNFLNDDIRILAKVGKKPRYWMMSKDYRVIQKESNDSKYTIQNMLKDDSTVYLAIIPHDEKAGKDINFIFKTTEYSCGTWNLSQSNWTFRHCLVGDGTTNTRMHCKCNHLSTFSSKIFVTPNQLVLPRGIVGITLNYVFLAFAIIFLLLLVACLLWAAYMDKHYSRNFYIGSKDAKNSYMYIVTVSTGNYPHAGTTAQVSIQLHGVEGESEVYLLTSSRDRRLCQRNTVYIFTVFTKRFLGKLTSVTLSHDGTGRYPSWYCSMVRVKDVEKRKEYIFLVQEWLSVIYNKEASFNAPLATRAELSKFGFLIREHVASKLGTCFLWHLFCNSHTNTILNRKEKTMTFFTAKAVGAFVSVLFFGQTTKYNVDDEHEEYHDVIIGLRVLFLVMIGMITSLITLALLAFCFMKSKMRRELQHQLVFAD